MLENIASIFMTVVLVLFCAFTGYVIIAGEKEEIKKKKMRKTNTTKSH